MINVLSEDEIIELLEIKTGIKNGEKYKDPDYSPDEEGWISEQVDASKLQFLSFFDEYKDPIIIKKAFCGLLFERFGKYDADNIYEFYTSNGEVPEDITLLKRIFNTPDETFKLVLENSETFKQVGMNAPREERYSWSPPVGVHYKTHLIVEMDLEKFKTDLKNAVLKDLDFMKNEFEDIRKHHLIVHQNRKDSEKEDSYICDMVLRANLFWADNIYGLAKYLRLSKYLDKRGIDKLILDIYSPVILKFDKRDEENILMRSFFYNNSRDPETSQNDLGKCLEKADDITTENIKYFLGNGASVEEKKEHIEPIYGRSYSRIIDEIYEGNFKFSKKPINLEEFDEKFYEEREKNH